MNPRTRIKGNFLIENSISDDGSVTFSEDPAWRGSTMAFDHILRDKDESIVTVSLTEISTLNETLYQMDKETYDEIVSVSYDFQYSLEQERQNRIDQEREEEDHLLQMKVMMRIKVVLQKTEVLMRLIISRNVREKERVIDTSIFCLC